MLPSVKPDPCPSQSQTAVSGTVINLSEIGATIIQQDTIDSTNYGAAGVFQSGPTCDAPGNVYISNNNFLGVALTLDLGAVYSIGKFWMRNVGGGSFNDR